MWRRAPKRTLTLWLTMPNTENDSVLASVANVARITRAAIFASPATSKEFINAAEGAKYFEAVKTQKWRNLPQRQINSCAVARLSRVI